MAHRAKNDNESAVSSPIGKIVWLFVLCAASLFTARVMINSTRQTPWSHQSDAVPVEVIYHDSLLDQSPTISQPTDTPNSTPVADPTQAPVTNSPIKPLHTFEAVCKFKDPAMNFCHFIPYGLNFGDELGPAASARLVERHFNCSAEHLPVKNLAKKEDTQGRKGYTCLFTLGSIFHMVKGGDHVWGTGVNPHWQRAIPEDLHIYAVRGDGTDAFLRKRNVTTQMVPHGDPGFLIPALYNIRSAKHGEDEKFCFVPHAQDNTRVDTILKESGAPDPDLIETTLKGITISRPRPIVHVISVQQHWEEVVTQLQTCTYVASSSLHGIIMADALGIPALWFQFADGKTKKTEGHFKYEDYYSTVGRKGVVPVTRFEDVSFGELYVKILSEEMRNSQMEKMEMSFPYHLFDKL